MDRAVTHTDQIFIFLCLIVSQQYEFLMGVLFTAEFFAEKNEKRKITPSTVRFLQQNDVKSKMITIYLRYLIFRFSLNRNRLQFKISLFSFFWLIKISFLITLLETYNVV
jgi:hypothetical protein